MLNAFDLYGQQEFFVEIAKYANSTQEFYEGLGFIYMELIKPCKRRSRVGERAGQGILFAQEYVHVKKVAPDTEFGRFPAIFPAGELRKIDKGGAIYV